MQRDGGIPRDGEGNFLNRLRVRVRTRGLPRRLPPDASLPSARCSNASQQTPERLSTDACRRKNAHRFGENAHRFPKSAHRFPPNDGSFACIRCFLAGRLSLPCRVNHYLKERKRERNGAEAQPHPLRELLVLVVEETFATEQLVFITYCSAFYANRRGRLKQNCFYADNLRSRCHICLFHTFCLFERNYQKLFGNILCKSGAATPRP